MLSSCCKAEADYLPAHWQSPLDQCAFATILLEASNNVGCYDHADVSYQGCDIHGAQHYKWLVIHANHDSQFRIRVQDNLSLQST